MKYLLLLAIMMSVSPAFAADDYAFILKGRGNVFWKVIDQGVRETAAKNDINVLVYNTDDDQRPEAQLAICETVIERAPKVIVLGAATKAVGIECYKKAHAAGIIVADIDGNVTMDDAKAAGVPLAFSVGSDNVKIGRRAARYVAQNLDRPDPKILIIEGLPGSIVSDNRRDGFVDVLREKVPQARIVASLAGNWDRQAAMTITTDTLTRVPDLDVIYSVSDVMTMGVVEAVRVAGKSGQITIVSVDGIADARKAVRGRRIAADVAQLPYLMGKRAIELAQDAAAGKVTGVTEYVPTPLLTKPALEMENNKELKYVR